MDVNVDFLAAETWDDKMPDRLRWLQAHDPVHWSPLNELWVVSKYDDVSYVSKNHRIFCSGHGVRPGSSVKIGLIDEDEPRHTKLRGLINKGFTPRMVSKLEGPFRQIVTETIDNVASKGACDFVTDVAVPIPLLLIAEMIGIRKEDRQQFHHWSDALIAADGNLSDPDVMAEATKAFMAYSAYVSTIIEDRRRTPRDDLVSILVGAKDTGDLGDIENVLPMAVNAEHQRLANDELIMFLVILLVAGNETTRNAISGGMQLLIENPEQRRKLLARPELLGSAVEEMIRLVSPVRTFGRTATQNTELKGKRIKQGQTVLMVYSSANRDPDEFPNPDAFDIERNPDHLAFGIGNHYCLGANLARMEMRVTFETLLRRLPDMEFAGPGAVLKPSALVRSCVSMPVCYTPEGTGSSKNAAL